MSNPWFAISTGLAGIIVGYVLGTSMAGSTAILQPSPPIPSAPIAPDAPAAPATPPTLSADDHVLGDKNAKVTLVEYTDYQCPFCGRHFTQTYGEIKKNYVDTGKVKMVVRDYPLSFHPHAQKAAEASECAADQGKFWEMHDKLFATVDTWTNLGDAAPTFKQYAADLKLDAAKFATCLDGGEKAAEVTDDMTSGSAAGVNGTPGFWVLKEDGTGTQISGAVPYAQFQAAIDAAL